MKKLFFGSGKLQNHFKMIRIKYTQPESVENIKTGVMELMSGYLQNYGGYHLTYSANSSTLLISKTAMNCWFIL